MNYLIFRDFFWNFYDFIWIYFELKRIKISDLYSVMMWQLMWHGQKGRPHVATRMCVCMCAHLCACA